MVNSMSKELDKINDMFKKIAILLSENDITEIKQYKDGKYIDTFTYTTNIPQVHRKVSIVIIIQTGKDKPF